MQSLQAERNLLTIDDASENHISGRDPDREMLLGAAHLQAAR